MDHEILTAERLRDLLDYAPETGIFTWRIGRRGKSAGAIAGSKHSGGYSAIMVDKKHYFAHRLAWLHFYGEWPQYDIDHINGVRDDNRIANLRDVPRLLNNQNLRKAHSGSRSGLLGVLWDSNANKWRAKIRVNGDTIYLGNFTDKSEASEAYLEAKRRLHAGCTI